MTKAIYTVQYVSDICKHDISSKLINAREEEKAKLLEGAR